MKLSKKRKVEIENLCKIGDIDNLKKLSLEKMSSEFLNSLVRITFNTTKNNKNNKCKILEYLFECGANTWNNGLLYATDYDYLSIIKLIINKLIINNVEIRFDTFNEIFLYTCNCNHYELMKLLICFNKQTNYKYFPKHSIVNIINNIKNFNLNRDILDFLLSEGASEDELLYREDYIKIYQENVINYLLMTKLNENLIFSISSKFKKNEHVPYISRENYGIFSVLESI